MKLELPPEALLIEARLQVGGRWALFACLLILVVGLSKGIPWIVALLVLCGSGAAAMIAAWYILPAFLRLWRMKHGRRGPGQVP